MPNSTVLWILCMLELHPEIRTSLEATVNLGLFLVFSSRACASVSTLMEFLASKNIDVYVNPGFELTRELLSIF
jgi:hypothetical protein